MTNILIISSCGQDYSTTQTQKSTTRIIRLGEPAPKIVHNIKVPEELRTRDGLPNFFAKLAANKTVNVGYIGGSITEQPGWRSKTFRWLKQQYPNANVTHTNAAISGTGADFAAARFKTDLLPHNPDLVFIEYRVNAGKGFEARAIEGLVRQIWENNPQTDICFVYTIAQWMLVDLENNQQHWFGQIMEKLANKYGIPSIDLGVEVVKQKKAGKLIFKSDVPIKGKLVFSQDGIHPNDAGSELYKEVVARSLLAMLNIKGDSHVLPTPITPKHFANASLKPVNHAQTTPGWKAIDITNDAFYISDRQRTHDILRGGIVTATEGEKLTINWDGRILGFTVIPQATDIIINVATDDKAEHAIIIKKNDAEYTYAQQYYAPEYDTGIHTTTVTAKTISKDSALYLGQFIIIGDPNGTPLPPISTDSKDEISVTRIKAQLSATDMTFIVNYSASENRTLYAEIRGPVSNSAYGPWLGAAVVNVAAGRGVEEMIVKMSAPPAKGNYILRTHIRPLQTDWQAAIDNTDAYFEIK
ncbi:MAG: SGNH/GDSL hydrolase family protein [Thalassotalea sp.]